MSPPQAGRVKLLVQRRKWCHFAFSKWGNLLSVFLACDWRSCSLKWKWPIGSGINLLKVLKCSRWPNTPPELLRGGDLWMILYSPCRQSPPQVVIRHCDWAVPWLPAHLVHCRTSPAFFCGDDIITKRQTYCEGYECSFKGFICYWTWNVEVRGSASVAIHGDAFKFTTLRGQAWTRCDFSECEYLLPVHWPQRLRCLLPVGHTFARCVKTVACARACVCVCVHWF